MLDDCGKKWGGIDSKYHDILDQNESAIGLFAKFGISMIMQTGEPNQIFYLDDSTSEQPAHVVVL